MQLDKLAIHLQPRNGWQAIDLGCRMALFWYRPLLLIWLSLALPVFIALLWFSPLIAILAVWLLKPLFERALLFYISRAVFSAPPGIKETLKSWPKELKNGWFSCISWRRIFPSRSFNLAAIQLEQLKGSALSKRLSVLHRSNDDQSGWWGLICFLWEWVIVLGLMAFLGMMTPEGVGDFNFYQLIYSHYWAACLAILCFIGFSLMTPFYLTAGFSLYLNRRVELEAWDLEIEFKKINKRLSGITNALLLGICMAVFSFSNPPLMAAEFEPGVQPKVQTQGSEQVDKQLVDELESFHQNLTEIYKQPPFENIKTQKVLKWVGPEFTAELSSESDWLNSLKEFIEFASFYIEIGMWCAFAVLVGFIIYYLHGQVFFWRNPVKKRFSDETQLPDFTGLNHEHGDLFDTRNFKMQFEAALNESNLRLALSLLIQANLLKLVNEYPVKLSKAMTEKECLAQIQLHVSEPIYNFIKRLFGLWIELAWAHEPAEKNQVFALYQQMDTVFQPAEIKGKVENATD